MTGSAKGLALVISILVVAAIVVGCSSLALPQRGRSTPTSPQPTPGFTPKTPSGGLVQSSTGGAVTIEVKWLVEEKDSLVFDVSMNTHSVDLDGYDLKERAVLRDDQGNEYHPISWKSAPGGHHRSGKLTFGLLNLLSQGKAKSFELVLRNIAGVKERVLRWEV